MSDFSTLNYPEDMVKTLSSIVGLLGALVLTLMLILHTSLPPTERMMQEAEEVIQCHVAGYTPTAMVYTRGGDTWSDIRTIRRSGVVWPTTVVRSEHYFPGWPIVNTQSSYLIDLDSDPVTYHTIMRLYSFSGAKWWEEKVPGTFYGIHKFDANELIWLYVPWEQPTVWMRLDLKTWIVEEITPRDEPHEERPSKVDVPADILARRLDIRECDRWAGEILGLTK